MKFFVCDLGEWVHIMASWWRVLYM